MGLVVWDFPQLSQSFVYELALGLAAQGVDVEILPLNGTGPERVGGLDEKMLSTKEHIDFCMSVREAGGSVWFEPSSVVTYVFPCRARPITPEDWPFFALRWSNAHGTRSLEHFIRKWGLKPDPGYVESKQGIYSMRRMQGILVPLFRRVPVVNRSDWLTRKLARAAMFPERLVNTLMVARDDRRNRGGA